MSRHALPVRAGFSYTIPNREVCEGTRVTGADERNFVQMDVELLAFEGTGDLLSLFLSTLKRSLELSFD